MDDQVFAVGYRRLEGGRGAWPPWAIARTLLTLAWRKRSTKFVLLSCVGVTAFHGAWIVMQMLGRRYGGGAMDGAFGVENLVGSTQETLSNFLFWQFYMSAIAVAVIGGGAVADDSHAGAFELYFSRPLTRAQYAIGKLLGVGLIPAFTVLLSVVALWLMAIGIAPDALRPGLWPLAIPVVVGGTVATVVLTTTIVGLSAVGQKARTVGVAYATGIIVLGAVARGLYESGYVWAGYLSPERDMQTLVEWLLGIDRASLAGQFLRMRAYSTNDDVLLSMIALAAFAGIGLALLWQRIRRAVVA